MPREHAAYDQKTDWMTPNTVMTPAGSYQLTLGKSGLALELAMQHERNQQLLATVALAGVTFSWRTTPQGFNRVVTYMPSGKAVCECNNILAAARHAKAILDGDHGYV